MKYLITTFVLLFVAASTVVAETGGYRAFAPGGDKPCLTDAQRSAIRAEVSRNEVALRAQGLLPPTDASAAYIRLGWPVVNAPGNDDYGVWGISGFVDHDPTGPGNLLDWNCGTRTYDLDSGYDHRGTDIFTFPFPWMKMDNEEVWVVAGAAGTIVGRIDGNYDRECGINPGAEANYLAVRHGDGSIVLYGHLKNGSVTSKTVGESIFFGEYVGVVGSSGQSTGPHLHMELYDSGDNLIDPFAGPCNSSTVDSWWTAQRPYMDRAVLKVSSHSQLVEFNPCPVPWTPYYETVFSPGEVVYNYAWGRDLDTGDTVTFTMYRPDDSYHSSWSYTHPDAYGPAWVLYWGQAIPPAAQPGTWRVEVGFDGVAYTNLITVQSVPVAFADARATVVDGAVELEWYTVADEAFIGFDIMRAVHGSDLVRSILDGSLLDAGRTRYTDSAVRPGTRYTYTIVARESDGGISRSRPLNVEVAAAAMALDQNHPNQFNPLTTITYTLDAAAEVRIDVFDVGGRRVATIENGYRAAGRHMVAWSGRSDAGRVVGSGTYFYALRSGNRVLTRKMLLLK